MRFKDGDRVLYNRNGCCLEGVITISPHISVGNYKYIFTITKVIRSAPGDIVYGGLQFTPWSIEDTSVYSLIEGYEEEDII